MTRGAIFLIEDNDDDALLFRRALSKNGMTNAVIHKKDGADALDALFGRDGQQRVIPGLIILDLKMPRLSGLEVLKQLRSNDLTRGLPIVVLTTSSEQKDVFESYNLGANSYIRKPVEFDKFVDTVGQVARYWMHMNVPNPKFHE